MFDNNIVSGVISGILVVLIFKAITSYHQKTIRDDIKNFEFEKKHLAEMKRSSVEMNRSSFRAIFLVLLLVSMANITPNLLDLVDLPSKFVKLISMSLWSLVGAVSIKFYRRYEHLKYYKDYVKNIDIKLEKLKSKANKRFKKRPTEVGHLF